jgi:hypothetical protein
MRRTSSTMRLAAAGLAATLVAACSSQGGSARIEPGANGSWGDGILRAPRPTPWGPVTGGSCVNGTWNLCPGGGGCCAADESCCGDGSCSGDCSAATLPNGCPDYAPDPCDPGWCCSGEPNGNPPPAGSCGCADPTTCCGDGSCTCGFTCTCADPSTCCGDGSCNCGGTPVCTCGDPTDCCADGSCGCGTAPTCVSCADGTNCCADGSCGC